MKQGMQRATLIVGFALIGLIAMPAGAADCNQAGNLLSNCDTFLGRFYSPSLEVYSTWSDIFESIDSLASTESATITLDCRHSSDFEIRFDDALLGIDQVPVDLMSFSVE